MEYLNSNNTFASMPFMKPLAPTLDFDMDGQTTDAESDCSPNHYQEWSSPVHAAVPPPPINSTVQQCPPLEDPLASSPIDLSSWQAIFKFFRMAFELDQHLRRSQLSLIYQAFFVRGSSRKQYARNLSIALQAYVERWNLVLFASQEHAVTGESRHQYSRLLQVALDQYQQDWASQLSFQGTLFITGEDKVPRYLAFLATVQDSYIQQRMRLLDHSIKGGALLSITPSLSADGQPLLDTSVLHDAVPLDATEHLQALCSTTLVQSRVDTVVMHGQPDAAHNIMSADELDDIAQNFFG